MSRILICPGRTVNSHDVRHVFHVKSARFFSCNILHSKFKECLARNSGARIQNLSPMSSGAALLGFASIGVFLGNGLWSLLPTWRSEVVSHESVRVEGPVSDSAIASVECNCHCPPQDNHSLIAGAFAAGCLAAALLYFVINCRRAQPARVREVSEP